MFIDLGRVLSYNRTFNFVLSQRSGGKTFDAKYKSINRYKRDKRTTIWLRREKTEFSKEFIDKFFEDIRFKFPDDTFEIKTTDYGAEGFINGEAFIIFIALSVALKHKSIPFQTVWWLVFDEFITNPSVQRYLSGEVFRFLEFWHTVARPYTVLKPDGTEEQIDPKTRAVFLGNSISIVNPYFIEFKVMPDKYREFNVYEKLIVWFWVGKAHADYMKTTTLGQSIAGTDYGDYATENKFLLDNDAWIIDKPAHSRYVCGFTIEGYKIGCWVDYKAGLIYVNNQYDPTNSMVVVTTQDHQPNLLMIQHFKRLHAYKQLKLAFEHGRIRFNNHLAKQAFYDCIGIVRS